ncbi:RraA family protein [Candidatus Pantoea multigeneris]|uniref:Putative 4-hydroxy-4-methyl-2-oxoglutarate aldolase n=1 Tax=Candidatus Pantoea multigeneris TaxID=2608357 RepID=A0ABX0R4T2_9GAMM|nr:RraA family protein [Pantoea multigeneris]NIF20416.1 RraA family protein [Pantoea multigeneris]
MGYQQQPFNNDQDFLNALAKFDTASISDALDSIGISGGLAGIAQQTPGTRTSGFAFTVQYEPVTDQREFKNAANYIDQVPPGAIIVSSNNARTDCTVWGDILTHFANLKGISGTVIDGVARDIHTVLELNYPLFTRGRFMQSAKNRVQLKAVQVAVTVSGVTINPGDAIVADASGVVVIPRQHLQEVLEKAARVEETESRIIASINAGSTLEQARLQHRYDQPWLEQEAQPQA